MPRTGDAETSGQPARRGLTWGRTVRIVFIGIVVVVLARTVVLEGPDLRNALERLDVGSVLTAGALMGLAQVALWQSWHALLRGTGAPVPRPRDSALIFFVGQLGKYAPGGVWTVLAQAELGATRKVTRARGAVVGVASLIVLTVTGAAVGALEILASPEAFAAYWWTLVLLVAGVLVLSPPLLNRLVRIALRLTSRQTGTITLDTRSILTSVAWCLGWWLAAGLQAWVLARSLAPGAPPSTVVGGFALAWVIGLLVVIAPAGVGVREAALVLLLGGVLAATDALTLGLVSRAVFIVGDLASAVLVIGLRRRSTGSRSP